MVDFAHTGLPISSFYAGLLGLILIALSFHVVKARMKHEVSIGNGEIDALHVADRRQGNFVEYVPYAILLFALNEFGGTPPWMLHIMGGTLLMARILHPFGLAAEFELRAPRIMGSVMTWGVLAWMSCTLIWSSI